MKIQVRRGVFETNSSSIHSLTMCLRSDYEKWQNEEVYLCVNNWGYNDECCMPEIDNFYTKEECINYIDKNKQCFTLCQDIEKEFIDNPEHFGFSTFDNYGKGEEFFEGEFTTPNGEEVISFGYLGYDD